MRFFTAAVALFASVALAQQNNAINVPSGQSTLEVTAGQPVTITWSNPSSGTVTIKLQQAGNDITPDSGIVLTSTTPASDETFTFTIDPSQVNSHLYTIEIIDNTDPDNYNFSPNFGIANAQSTSTGTTSVSETATTGSSSATGSSLSNSSSVSESGSTSGSSASTTASETSSGSSSSTASASTTESSASSSTSSAASATTAAPNSNGGSADLKTQGSLIALVAVAVAVL